ncbi:MAG: hypothetical protein [Arizlama microvirus]|nr:MAG: hypothetical protein [Arizlama microvirus]
MSKKFPAIIIDPRYEDATVKAKVDIPTDAESEEFKLGLDYAMLNADWTEDPGTGRAVILEDGRELLNPVPVAPPAAIAAYSQELSVNDLVNRAIERHMTLLKGTDEIDTEEDLDDFPEDDDYHPITMYEAVLMRDEAPAIPPAPPPDPVLEPDPAPVADPQPRGKKKGADAPVVEGEGGE